MNCARPAHRCYSRPKTKKRKRGKKPKHGVAVEKSFKINNFRLRITLLREYAQPSETEMADIGNPPPFQWFGPRFFFFFSSNIGDRDQGMLGAVAKLQKAIVDEHELHAPSAASAACKMQRWAPYACSQLPEQPVATFTGSTGGDALFPVSFRSGTRISPCLTWRTR